MQYHIADLLTWEIRLHDDVRELPKLKTADIEPVREERSHVIAGARWARNQIAHGRAQLLRVERDFHVDNAWASPDIVENDPETDWNGGAAAPTIRFARVDEPILHDRYPDLQRFYNECVAGRRVLVATRIIRGMETFAGTPVDSQPSDTDLLDRWRRAIREIGDQMVRIRIRQQIFAELDDELIRNNKDRPASIATGWFLRPMYAEAQLVALRRLTVDTDSRTISLVSLINEIAARPQVLSRASYISITTDLPISVESAADSFDDIAGQGNDHVPVETLRTWRREVRADYQAIKGFVDKHVAHIDHDRERVETPTWGDIDAALASLERHVNRLHVPLTGTSLSDLPGVQTDWRIAFRGLFGDADGR